MTNIPNLNDKTALFARELTELCCRHGLALNGNPELFVMEGYDYHLEYAVDRESRLWFVGAPDGQTVATPPLEERIPNGLPKEMI